MPVHCVYCLCFLMQATEQLLAEQFGHVYFAAFMLQYRHMDERSLMSFMADGSVRDVKVLETRKEGGKCELERKFRWVFARFMII